MDSISGITIALSLIGLVLLVVLIVALLYKPGKKLYVHAYFIDKGEHVDESIVEVSVENTGKKQVKMLYPYIRFSHGTHSKIYQLKPTNVECKFPRILKIGEKISCKIDLHHYHDPLEKNAFDPTHVRFIIKDTVGMIFQSENLHIK
ncbi:MAG: hypothetical protein JW731_03535 [Bacteroidales bacterium]|nr:hypothetical protein [Bacteroidales bacterium]